MYDLVCKVRRVLGVLRTEDLRFRVKGFVFGVSGLEFGF